jgi:hypothetical protein
MAVKKSKVKKQAKMPKSSNKTAKKSVSAKIKPHANKHITGLGAAVSKKRVVIVYGMRVDPEHITRAAHEAFNKRRYTVHDLRLTEYITDPKFRNLMVKIAVLDRIEEELLLVYPDSEIIRPNTVTLIVR